MCNWKRIIASIATSILSLIPIFSFAATFTLETQNTQNNINCNMEVEIMIDTQEQEITAADIILDYDHKAFDIVGFTPGNFFGTNRGLIREPGRIRSTAINYPDPVIGKGHFGTLTLIPRKLGIHPLCFFVEKYATDATTDSNIAYKGKDYLNDVENIKFDVVSGPCSYVPIHAAGFVEYDATQDYDTFVKERLPQLEPMNFWTFIGQLLKQQIFIIIFIIIICVIIISIVKRNKEKK